MLFHYSHAWLTWGSSIGTEANDRYDYRLSDRVVVGEYCVGFVRSAELDDAGQLVHDEHIGHLDTPGAWRQGDDGYIYVGALSERRRKCSGWDQPLLPGGGRSERGRLAEVARDREGADARRESFGPVTH
jgi:hypothetical protein